MTEMFTNTIMVTILQYSQVSNHHIIQLKLIQCYMLIISQIWGRNENSAYTVGPSNSLHTQKKCIHMYQNDIPENDHCCTICKSQKLETTANFSISRKAICMYLMSRKVTCMYHDTCMQLYAGVKKKWVKYNYMLQHGWISHTYCTIAFT